MNFNFLKSSKYIKYTQKALVERKIFTNKKKVFCFTIFDKILKNGSCQYFIINSLSYVIVIFDYSAYF